MNKETSAVNPAPTTNIVFPPARRDERGLLSGVEYKFLPDGSVDWRAMLKPEHLYLNVGNRTDSGYAGKVAKLEKKYGKKLSDVNVKEAEDRDLCILLAGIRYLANLRGYIGDRRTVNHVTYDPHYQVVAACTVTSEIDWVGNFETDGMIVVSTDVAGAALGNCHSFTQKYVETIASNRAFARNVRAFLNIGIVAKDEIGPDGDLKPIHNEETTTPSGNQPEDVLEQFVKATWPNTAFEQFKKAVIAKCKDLSKNPEYKKLEKLEKNPEEWTAYNTIPRNDIFTLLGTLKEAEKNKRK